MSASPAVELYTYFIWG